MPDGEIAAVLSAESEGEAYFQVRPEVRAAELEGEMLDAVETHLATCDEKGNCSLGVWADSQDVMRRGLLHARGYEKDGTAEHQHRRFLDRPIPEPSVAQGFTLRPLGDIDELPARSWFSWRAC